MAVLAIEPLPATTERVNQRNLTRILAITCVLAALPIAFLILPWLPATILEFAELLRAPVPTWATESFRTSRDAHLHHLEVALTLYALSLLALAGLVAIAAKIVLIWGELLLWFVAAATAVSITSFWGPSISPTTDRTFTFIVVRLPLMIAAISGLGAVVNLAEIGVRLYRNPGR